MHETFSIRLIPGEELATIIPLLRVLNDTIAEATLRERLADMAGQGYRCAGLYDGSRLIGICGLWIVTKYYVGRHVEPDNLVMLDEYRGLGHGRRLIAWVHDYARSQGCVASELNCYLANRRGQEFWEHNGYRPIAHHYRRLL